MRLLTALSRRRVALAVLVVAGLLVVVTSGDRRAAADVDVVVSEAVGSDGTVFWVENHLVRSAVTAAVAPPTGREYLLVWAGSENAADFAITDDIPEDYVARVTTPGPDFLAVIDADPASPTYGKVVNTVTVGPVVENEPHHMQYLYHKGDRVFAGGLYTDTTYVFDVSNLPVVTLAGVNQPHDTPCSSVPDAYWTLPDHTAYGTYMGGANVPGPCTYTNGEVRQSNGYGGSPGAIVRIGPDGRTLAEVPAALPGSEDPAQCPNYPDIPGQATCANPHGIQGRNDLNRIVASDYAEPRNIILNPAAPRSDRIFRNTVRTFDTTDPNNPKLVSVSTLPDGPRASAPRPPVGQVVGTVMTSASKWGIMETTITNRRGHKGAFAASMCGGVVYYTADVTAFAPTWREVFDVTTAARALDPSHPPLDACAGGGWLQTSLDDRFLYHAVIGRSPGTFSPQDPGIPKMVFVLDIAGLIDAGTSTTCSVDTMQEVLDGGGEPDCPKVASVLPLPDDTSGGPHWGAPDNFVKLPTGKYTETTSIRRMALSNYFVGRTGLDGNHQVCMASISPGGRLALDENFRDEHTGNPCVDFDRDSWPHGPFGKAKPHSELFVVPDASLQ